MYTRIRNMKFVEYFRQNLVHVGRCANTRLYINKTNMSGIMLLPCITPRLPTKESVDELGSSRLSDRYRDTGNTCVQLHNNRF